MNSVANRAHVAAVIFSCFAGSGDSQPEGWVKLMLCETAKTHEAVVDEVIDELCDAGFLRSTVEQHGDTFVASLVLTPQGGRHIFETRARREGPTLSGR